MVRHRRVFKEGRMSDDKQGSGNRGTPPGPSKRRIETQIHRRKKIKGPLPLEAEWEAGSSVAPKGLRMPAQKLKK